TAYINGSQFKMDVAPVIIEGRTLVPLRFVSEAYGAYVDWDNKAKRVAISTNGGTTPPKPPTTPPASDYNLYFNDKKVTTSTPPILKNSRIQISMEYLLQ